jgi:GNAT superfamily N-acetyltransferase
MTSADIPAGMRLKEIAGWNQTPADWEHFLRASPEGCFVAESGGRVAGTAATITYEGRFAWIGMVLVDPEFRGQGIGTHLLEKTIEYLDARRVPSLKLDATPQGKPIYEKLGFVAEYEIERWLLKRAPGSEMPRPAAPTHLDGILTLDCEVFGADRSELLRSLDREAPAFTLETRHRRDLLAYALGRRGSRADHLGPWMAREEASARALLDEFLRRSERETVFVDCLRSNPWARALLAARRFEFSRPLTRMVRGSNAYPGRPELLCAILGPEFG